MPIEYCYKFGTGRVGGDVTFLNLGIGGVETAMDCQKECKVSISLHIKTNMQYMIMMIKMPLQKNAECTNWSYDPDSNTCFTKNDDAGEPVESALILLVNVDYKNYIRGVRDCSMKYQKSCHQCTKEAKNGIF